MTAQTLRRSDSTKERTEDDERDLILVADKPEVLFEAVEASLRKVGVSARTTLQCASQRTHLSDVDAAGRVTASDWATGHEGASKDGPVEEGEEVEEREERHELRAKRRSISTRSWRRLSERGAHFAVDLADEPLLLVGREQRNVVGDGLTVRGVALLVVQLVRGERRGRHVVEACASA